MRSSSRILLLLVAASWVALSCKKTAYPTESYPVNAADRLLVSNVDDMSYFDGARKLIKSKAGDTVSPYLYNIIMPVAGWYFNPSDADLRRTNYSPSNPTGANGTLIALRMTGTLVDLGNGEYPSYQLRLGLKSTSFYYDISFFEGVQFYWKVGAADTALLRNFNFNLKRTVPSIDGGTCDNSAKGCYNNLMVALEVEDNERDQWIQVKKSFTSFARENWGNPLEPSTLSGQNLREVVALEWQEKRNNVPGTSIIDYYVDEVRFY